MIWLTVKLKSTEQKWNTTQCNM